MYMNECLNSFLMGIKKYDKLNRLSKVQYPNATEEFEYDMAGNRIKRAFNNITTSYDYDRRNRLTEKVEGGVQTSYRYDPQGNLIAEEGRHGITRYTYDCFNLTASIQSAMGGYVQNRYDPEELRYELWENGKLSRFIFSGREVDANYSLKAAIVRGHEILAQKDVRDNSYYYLNNAHGDVVGLVDAKGTVVNSYKYDAFGNIVEAKEQVHNRFKYAGEQFDQVTGQYYLRARFYNPVVGRFTQEDVYRGDGLNLYTYVHNNPIKYVDPSGYSSCMRKTNLWNEFQKANKGKYASQKEMAETYRKLVTEQSPWPDGFVPVKDVLKPGTRFEMALSPGQDVTSPGAFGTFDIIRDKDFVRNELAVKLAWKPDVDRVVTYEVVQDLPVNVGPIGPQIDEVAGKYLSGGASQLEMLVPKEERMNYLKVVAVRDIY